EHNRIAGNGWPLMKPHLDSRIKYLFLLKGQAFAFENALALGRRQKLIECLLSDASFVSHQFQRGTAAQDRVSLLNHDGNGMLAEAQKKYTAGHAVQRFHRVDRAMLTLNWRDCLGRLQQMSKVLLEAVGSE